MTWYGLNWPHIQFNNTWYNGEGGLLDPPPPWKLLKILNCLTFWNILKYCQAPQHCHNTVTALLQHFHNTVTALLQHCHNSILTLLLIVKVSRCQEVKESRVQESGDQSQRVRSSRSLESQGVSLLNIISKYQFVIFNFLIIHWHNHHRPMLNWQKLS